MIVNITNPNSKSIVTGNCEIDGKLVLVGLKDTRYLTNSPYENPIRNSD